MEVKPHNTIDNALLAAAKNGDQKAYTALMEKYRNSVYHLILKIVKSPQDAEDLMIESFAKAFDHLDQYSTDFAFSTWLYKITSNTCIDFLRKKRIEKVSLENQGKEILDNLNFSTSTNPELDLIKSQRIDKMQHVVNSMDEIFSRVIALRYFKEYSYEEISEELNIPVGTIKVQLHRAKKILLEKFTDEKDKW
ncbi:MAG TPA: sigma-70 family RNA polymerase sigma factor [Chitinophagales bacterium]|nr:sigma-70 family RNA polymerase sigma factor [Chitinophagales bacterium]HPH87814.1 sigma-70 family RNA polymerase sigma factor [Chitinophagales bacterium]HPN18519.1 sigma-70 family RNA polymerase sigma factor [Chitinophagales bacterium]